MLAVLLFVAWGVVAGSVHFTAIARNADRLVNAGPRNRIAPWRLGRLALTGLMLVVATLQGPSMLLASVAGFLAGRQIVLRRLGACA